MSTTLKTSLVHQAALVTIAAALLLAASMLAAVSPAHAANSCTAFQSNKAVSGSQTSLPNADSYEGCAAACTNYASQTGVSQNCQAYGTYYPNMVCWPYPDGSGCGMVDMGGQTLYTCSAGTGAITSGSYSAATCAYAPAPSVSVTAAPSTVQNGGSTVISWNATNATSCDLTSIGGSATGLASGSKSVTVNAGSASSQTYTITCKNSAGATASDSATVTVSNPNTPASCTPWSGTTYPNNTAKTLSSYNGYDSSQASAVAASCPTTCANAAASDGTTYTCGYQETIITNGVGGHNYNGVEGQNQYFMSCIAGSGSGTTNVPSSSSSGTVTVDGQTYDSSQVDSNVVNSCNNTTGTCAVYQQQTNYGGSTTCNSSTTGAPDLTASSITPITATVNQQVTLVTTIANIGTGSTGVGFTDKFQLSSSADGSDASDIGTYPNSALAANSSKAATLPHTFDSAGTYYVRACADSTNSIYNESNENNNCGPWTAITVTVPYTSSCSPWDTTRTPSGPIIGAYDGGGSCAAACAAYTELYGGTNTCGLYSGTQQWGFNYADNPGLGWASAVDNPGSICLVTSGSATAPSNSTSYSSMDSYFNCDPRSGNACSGGYYAYNEEGATTCVGTQTVHPDLTAANVTQTSATVNVPLDLTALITNGGNTTTGTGFYNLFQQATDANGSNPTDLGTYLRTTAATAGADFTATLTHTFSSTGTWYLRACADKSSQSDTGTINNELSETNNCSPGWTAIHVCVAGQSWNGTECSQCPAGQTWNGSSCTTCPAGQTWNGTECSQCPAGQTWNGTSCTTGGGTPTCSLTANPQDSVPSTLTWSSTNANSCTGGGFATGGATSGTATVNAAGPYSLTCSGASNSCSTSVNVGNSCGTANVSISASPDRVRKGNTTTVSWSATGVDNSCIVTENGTTIATISSNACNVPTTTRVRTINTQTIYKITCDDEKTAQTVVNLIPAFQEF